MEQKTIKALFVNGGPRKNKNTAQMLESAMQGAKDAGAEVELVHLYDLDYKGCKSCFACQLKNAKTDGVCAIRDGLRPVLEKAREADVIVIGSNHPKIRHKVSANRMKYQINLSISKVQPNFNKS